MERFGRRATMGLGTCLALAVGALGQDMNSNLVDDYIDLRMGTSFDCNLNGTVDEADALAPHFNHAIETLNDEVQFQNNVFDIAPLDFNGDGLLDLAVTSMFSTNHGRITLWRNEGGAAQVHAGQIEFPDGRPYMLRAADLNGDGRPDLVSSDASFQVLHVMLATGPETFAPSVTVSGSLSNNGSVGLEIGDLDNDGDIDVAMSSWEFDSVDVFLNSGAGAFTFVGSFAAGDSPRGVAIGDFTGDGVADIAVANSFYYLPGQHGTVSLLRNGGDGTTFVTHGTITLPPGHAPFPGQAEPESVAFSDLDHDGDLDLVASARASNVLSIHKNDGAGAFTLAQSFGGISIESQGRDVLVTDLDGDGWDDIAWGDPDMAINGIYRNNAGTLEFHQNFATATYGSINLAAGDFNNDGLIDIVSANDSARTFSLQINKGALNFEAPIHLRPTNYPFNFILADFTSDGLTDAAFLIDVGPEGGEYNFAIYRGLGDAVFAKQSIDTLITLPGVILARDVNNDGKQDLLSLVSQVTVRLGNGDGTFGAPISSGLTSTNRHMTADINNDGNLDIVWVWPSHPGEVEVSFGDGAGHFATEATYGIPNEQQSLGIGDITGDGFPEIFTGHRLGKFAVLTNLGDGTFGPARIITLFATPLQPVINAIAVADFDLDGDGDVVVSTTDLLMFFNPGDGNLPEVPTFASETPGSILVVADIDLDGTPDLYERNARAMAILNEAGTGIFTREISLRQYDSNARTMVVADANNDGRPDVAIGPENSWGQYLFLNLPAASTDANQDDVPDECQATFVRGDMNCDGVLTVSDIGPFVLALTNPTGYAAQYPTCGILAGDVNADGFVTVGDIGGFVALLTK